MLPLLLLIAPAHAGNFLPADASAMDRVVSLLGLGGLVAIAWLLSIDRKSIRWRPVIWGIGLQLVFGAVILAPEVQDSVFKAVDAGVHRMLSFVEFGADFVFQTVQPHQITVGFGQGEVQTFAGHISPPMKTFAFWILPTIIFFSSLMSVLYHLGVMQWLVGGIAWVMQRTMGTSGSESLAAAANIFVGQTEAPLVIRPYVDTMTRSELHALMTGGFATVSGGIMAAYVSFLEGIPGIAGHLVTASILSAPAALAISKVMVPETGQSVTAGKVSHSVESEARNLMEAAANGATDGMKLAINVAAMLVAFVAFVHMADWFLSLLPISVCDGGLTLGHAEGCGPITLSQSLGWLFAPIAWLMGVPWAECDVVGQLLGEKIVLTEFLAYLHLADIVNAPVAVLSERSAVIASYALCGFANFASIGIQLGGIGGIAPRRMGDLADLGMRAMIAGSLAAFMTGNVVGLFM